MPAPSEKPLVRICTRIFKEDLDFIHELERETGVSGTSLIIRQTLNKTFNHFRDLRRQKLDQQEISRITTEDLTTLLKTGDQNE